MGVWFRSRVRRTRSPAKTTFAVAVRRGASIGTGLVLVVCTVFVFTPINSNTGDSIVNCGSLARPHPHVLRRDYCLARDVYSSRASVTGLVAFLAVVLLVVPRFHGNREFTRVTVAMVGGGLAIVVGSAVGVAAARVGSTNCLTGPPSAPTSAPAADCVAPQRTAQLAIGAGAGAIAGATGMGLLRRKARAVWPSTRS